MGEWADGRRVIVAIRPSGVLVEFPVMPDEPKVIPPSRFLRWVVLAVLIVAGAVLYFRYGVRLPLFGSASPAGADSSR